MYVCTNGCMYVRTDACMDEHNLFRQT